MRFAGPKIMRSRASRGAAAADAKFIFRLFYFNGYFLHFGKQAGRTEEFHAYHDAISRTSMRLNWEHFQE